MLFFQNADFLLSLPTCDCILFSRLFNFFCPPANLFSSLFNSFLNSFLFFLLSTKREYPVIEIRAGHQTMAWQKHCTTSSKFLQLIIVVLNFMIQMSKFELNKDMHILGQNWLFICNRILLENPFKQNYVLNSKMFVPINFDRSQILISNAEHDILVYLVNSGEIEKCCFLIHDLTWFDTS